ncbi:MAG: tetratricopeptide repeat-containing sulfotransferase family protein [Gammaproteobacteria bacterium]
MKAAKAARLFSEGLERLQTGQLPAAEKRFRAALKSAPGDARVLHYLGLCQFQQGRTTEGLHHLRRSVERDPENSVFLINLGEALRQSGDPLAATPFLEQALAKVPGDAAVLGNLGLCLMDQGRLDEALPLLGRALAADPRSPNHRLNHAIGLRNARRLDQALEEFEALWRDVGEGPDVAREYGLTLQALGNFREARAVYEAGLRAAPGDPVLLNNLANVLRADGDVVGAWEHLKEAVDSPGAGPDIGFNAAALLEAMNRTDEAVVLVRRGLKRAPGHPLGLAVRGVLARRASDLESAVTDLRAALESGLPGTFASWAWQNLGRALERLGRFEESFEAFSAMNAINRQAADEAGVGTEAMVADIEVSERLLESMETDDRWDPARASEEGPVPVFMVGFPRSGTTLLEQMLGSHPRVEAIEEQEMIAALVHDMGGVGEGIDGTVEAIRTMDDERISGLRACYWKAAREHLPDGDWPSVVVDKNPLNLVHAPFIARLFPEARWILSVRDPRDACFSAFVQNFDLNGGMGNFFDLDGAARFYDRLMTLWDRFVERMAPCAEIVPYESLVTDPGSELRRLCGFLGIDWDESMMDHRRRARAKVVMTSSYDQVVQPLYTDSMARWRGFAPHIESMNPRLAPWIERFGQTPA